MSYAVYVPLMCVCVCVCVTDADEGGETSFPENSEWVNPLMKQKYGSEFSECAKVSVLRHTHTHTHTHARAHTNGSLAFTGLDPGG